MTAALITVFLVAALLALLLYIPRLLLKRAVRIVVAEFRSRKAIGPESAATPEELGLGPTRPFQGMFALRDYRPYAVRLLAQANIIRSTDEGTVYLSEKDLAESTLKRFVGLD